MVAGVVFGVEEKAPGARGRLRGYGQGMRVFRGLGSGIGPKRKPSVGKKEGGVGAVREGEPKADGDVRARLDQGDDAQGQPRHLAPSALDPLRQKLDAEGRIPGGQGAGELRAASAKERRQEPQKGRESSPFPHGGRF